MSLISDNLVLLRKKQDLKQKELAFQLGIKPTAYSNYETGTSVPDIDTLLKISKFFGILLDDLLTADFSHSSQEHTIIRHEPQGHIPLIPIDAMAGYANGDVSLTYLDSESYVIPEFRNKADFLIRISGTSMSPKYYNGDIVACKKIPTKTFLQWGKVYIMDTVQGALCKRVFASKHEGNIICRSENFEMYPEFEIPWKEVRSLAIVVGVIRLE